MIVMLTRSRIEAVEKACRHNPTLLDALRLDRLPSQHVSGRWAIRAPYVAWKTAIDLLTAATFNKRGGVATSTTSQFKTGAISVIAKGLNAMDAHPAFHNAGVIGHNARAFPAWVLPDHPSCEGKPYSPMPVNGGRFIILKPTFHNRSQLFTTWSEDGIMPPDEPIYHEDYHLAIWRS